MKTNHLNRGFSLLELLIVLFIMGVAATITVPPWLGFMNTQRLNASQDRIYWAMRIAQSNAMKDKITWQVSFRQVQDRLQWAIHPATSSKVSLALLEWQELSHIRIDTRETTLDCSKKSCQGIENIWRVQFNDKGNTNGQLGRITLASKQGGRTRRCIIVSTLIGNIRTGKDHTVPDTEKRYCY
ncbi:hypothetical protein BST81_19360 [Leptolyngbya sp. 'hensonii']|uniref:pilus assembly FimT family protein n=1 Tax=Leptolyngbya sp. 'hensonii' TaxID=1922337 RepID=UPI00094F5540|nr:type II secretion system protein [Leptolyngbya sp. 'hensonii']OLP16855.1 hypothetical protein BST81_19360 [Leptolyngbya sp. 'hensonii']